MKTIIIILSISGLFMVAMPAASANDEPISVNGNIAENAQFLFKQDNKLKIEDTNSLIWNKQFKAMLKNDLEGHQYALLGRKQDLSEIMRNVLGGPPNDLKRVSENMIQASACRAGSCLEKGYFLIDFTSGKRGYAMLGYHDENQEYNSTPILNVIYPKRYDGDFGEKLKEYAQTWVREVTEEYKDSEYFDAYEGDLRIIRIGQ